MRESKGGSNAASAHLASLERRKRSFALSWIGRGQTRASRGQQGIQDGQGARPDLARDRGWRNRGRFRTIRVGQELASPACRRRRATRRGTHFARWPRRHGQCSRGPRRRNGVPELRTVSAYVGVRRRGERTQGSQGAPSRTGEVSPMSRDILLGIDAGTSVIKSVAFSLAGEQVAVAARPNVYQTLGGELGERIPNLAHRAAAVGVTAQGDGSWLIDAAGEPVGGGLLWLDSRAASLVSDYLRTDAYADHYALTGSGLNACMASAQLAWMKRWQPERIARAATCFHCKDWLYFKLTGDRVTDPSEGNFTFGNYRTREYEPSILEGMGIADCARLLPPMIEGANERGTLSAAGAVETLLPEGLPVSLAYLDVVCTGLGGGLCDPVGDVGVSILGSTRMHMRYVSTPDDVRLNKDRS